MFRLSWAGLTWVPLLYSEPLHVVELFISPSIPERMLSAASLLSVCVDLCLPLGLELQCDVFVWGSPLILHLGLWMKEEYWDKEKIFIVYESSVRQVLAERTGNLRSCSLTHQAHGRPHKFYLRWVWNWPIGLKRASWWKWLLMKWLWLTMVLCCRLVSHFARNF